MTSPQSLKIVFAGTPDFSASILQSLLSHGHQICAVYCQPDRRVGRGKKMAFGPVKQLAVEHQIPVEQPSRFNDEPDDSGITPLEKLKSYNADLMIVVAYGLILPQQVLKTPVFGCVNIHASLLPRWRGAAPIQRAIEAGDTQTGITVMQMDKGLDTGNMLLKRDCLIESHETGSSLHDRLAVIGSEAIQAYLSAFEKLKGSPLFPGEVQQNQQACYANKLSKAEAEIDWSNKAQLIERKIRAFNAWPVSYTFVGAHRIRVWKAVLFQVEAKDCEGLKAGTIVAINKTQILVACGDGECLALEQLQADGSRAMSVAEMLNSKRQWFEDNPVLGQ